MPDDHQQRNFVLHYGVAFVDPVANALVVGDRDAAMGAAIFQPLLIRAIRRKQIVVPLDSKAGSGQDCRKLFPEIAIGEKSQAQAARSYSTASSISSGLRS